MTQETNAARPSSEEFLATLPLRSDVTKLRTWLLWLSGTAWAFIMTGLSIHKLAVPGTSIEIVPPSPAETRRLLTYTVGLFTLAFILVVLADAPRMWEQWRQLVKAEGGEPTRWRRLITSRTGLPFLAAVMVWVVLPALLGAVTFVLGWYRLG